MSRPKLKSILVIVPPDGEPKAFRNFDGEFTKAEMMEAAERWLAEHPDDIVMYDDDKLTPDVRAEPIPEEGLVIDGLYVPPIGLYAPRGGIQWGERKNA